MIEIKDLLLVFRDALFSEEIKKDSIKNVLKQVVNLDINREDIEIKKGVLYLNIKPIYKNEILIKKDEINARLREILGGQRQQNLEAREQQKRSRHEQSAKPILQILIDTDNAIFSALFIIIFIIYSFKIFNARLFLIFINRNKSISHIIQN